jgi:hypothetical protein
MADCKKINVGPVVYEEYESEIIAINLDSGAYYSLVGASAKLWKLICAGASIGQLTEYFSAAHAVDPQSMARDVDAFLRRLQSESLVVDADCAPSGTLSLDPPSGNKTAFAGFDMSIYTDMRDLLLLDPVHDVGDSGWPAESKATQ